MNKNKVEQITNFVYDYNVVVMEKALCVLCGMYDLSINTSNGLYRKVENYIDRHEWDDNDSNWIQMNELSDIILNWIKNHKIVEETGHRYDDKYDVLSVFSLVELFMWYDPDIYSYVEPNGCPYVYVSETNYNDGDALLDKLNLSIPSRVAVDFLVNECGFKKSDIMCYRCANEYSMSVRNYSINSKQDYEDHGATYNRGDNHYKESFNTLVYVFNKDNVK